MAAEELRHDGCPMSRVLAMEDYQCWRSKGRRGDIEQVLRQLLLIIEVDSTINMTTIVLVLESAVNDDDLVMDMAILAV